MNMPVTATWFGRLLIFAGILAYGYTLANGSTNYFALIPAAFGVAFLVLGYSAIRRVNMRRHIMHIAVLLALIGVLFPLIRFVYPFGDAANTAATVSQIVMSLLCLGFLVLSIRSFITARSR